MTRSQFQSMTPAERMFFERRGVIVTPDPIDIDYDEDDDGTEPLDPDMARLGDAIDEPTKVGIGPHYDPHKL